LSNELPYENVLRCVAVCCSELLQCMYRILSGKLTSENVWSVLQCIAVCCSESLQCVVALHVWILSSEVTSEKVCGVLQCVAVCCSVLQCVAVSCCSVCIGY